MQLYGIEGSHFHIIEFSVPVNIDAAEPVPNRNVVRLVFLYKEVYEVRICKKDSVTDLFHTLT